MPCMSIFESTDPERSIPEMIHEDRRFPDNDLAKTARKVGEREEESNSGSSSIGRNSDLSERSSDDDDSGEKEVQSSYKGPLHTMDALEEVLPIRRGISNFYPGKSKSFTNLAFTTSSSSIKDIAKPENSYTRKRKNLLAHNIMWNKNRNLPLRSNEEGLLKIPTNSSLINLVLTDTVAKSISENNNASNISSSPPQILPPLHPQEQSSNNNIPSLSSSPPLIFSPRRSFSLMDLQGIATATTRTISSTVTDRDKHMELN